MGITFSVLGFSYDACFNESFISGLWGQNCTNELVFINIGFIVHFLSFDIRVFAAMFIIGALLGYRFLLIEV